MEIGTVGVILGAASSASLLILMLRSAYSLSFRFWPPGSRNMSWAVYWALASTNTISILLMLIPELSTFTITLNSMLSLLLIFSGLVIAFLAIKQLGLRRTSGLKDEFKKKGLYRYSRNPQVLGNLVTLFGVAALLRTLMPLLVTLITGSWLIAMVFSEERWLNENYGDEYAEYREQVPRFI